MSVIIFGKGMSCDKKSSMKLWWLSVGHTE